jgi:chromosome partitioning protein
MSKVLVILNGKGGVGKTTTAFNVSAVFAQSKSVLLVDADPQKSATWWAEQGDPSFDITSNTDPKILKKLKTVKDYDLIVCDTPPHLDSETLKAIVQVADYIILPTPPAPLDIQALIETIRGTITPTKVLHRVVLTKVDPRSLNEAMNAQTTFMQIGIPVFNSFIRHYKSHERAALDGLAIVQYKGKNAQEAASDYLRLVNELQELKEWK